MDAPRADSGRGNLEAVEQQMRRVGEEDLILATRPLAFASVAGDDCTAAMCCYRF